MRGNWEQGSGKFADEDVQKLNNATSIEGMKRLAIGALIFVSAAGFSLGQRVEPSKMKVGGVGLDSTYAQVLKVFGKPLKDPKPTREECIGGRERLIEYAGASFYLMDGDSKDGKTFELKSFEVTSPKYTVSGLRVGDTELAVRRRLGTKFSKQMREDASTVWSYEFSGPDSPGFTNISFKKGKIVGISVAYMVC